MPMSPVDTQVALKILVVDDHASVLEGVVPALKRAYPQADIQTVQTAQAALHQMQQSQPNVVITDLSMPDLDSTVARTGTGIQLLKTLMETYPTLNIVVQSAHVRSLIVLKSMIMLHEGGFTVVDKGMPLADLLTRVEWARQGLHCTPKEMRSGLEFRPEWLRVLHLACVECLQDQAIAKQMNVAEKSVQNYWAKIRDVLGVYPEKDKNLRMQTAKRAREEYLLDE